MDTDDLDSPKLPSVSPIRFRWWPAPVALTFGAMVQLAGAIFFGENRPYLDWACVFVIWPLTVFLLLLWWTFWSRLSWKTRGFGWLVVVLIFAASLAAFRFDEFDGAMIPRFSPRWQPSSKDRAAEFFKNASTQKVDEEKLNLDTDSLIPTDGDWPAFRGPNRDDVVIGESLRTDWDKSPPKLLWKHPIGSGWGAFAVIGRRAWTLEQRDDYELCVCYDIETGREVWTHADDARFSSPQGGVGPCSTPTVHDGRLYTQGATGVLNCLDALTGKLEWTHNTLEDAGSPNLSWGQCGSPLIVNDLVIVSPGSNDTASQANQSAVIAYHRVSGEKVWKSGDRIGSYASPHLATFDGVPQVLIYDGRGLQSLAINDGHRLWKFDWENGPQINASQPLLVGENRVLIGSGYGKGSVFLYVDNTDGNLRVVEGWQSKQLKTKFNGAVQHHNFVFGLDEGMLTCIDLLVGKRLWKQGRYGYGQMLLVGDKLLILSEEGDVVLVTASPEMPSELARFHAIDGKTWNHPVLSRGRLIVRNSDEAACFDLR